MFTALTNEEIIDQAYFINNQKSLYRFSVG